MIPKSHKDILNEVIEDNNYDKVFTEDAVSFFWSEIRRHLSDITYTSITVRRLGIFNIKHWKVEEYIDTYKKHLDSVENSTFKKFKYRKKMEEQYESFIRIKQMLDEQVDKKKDVKEKREKYESAKTMGEQIQDNGGTPEQRNQEG